MIASTFTATTTIKILKIIGSCKDSDQLNDVRQWVRNISNDTIDRNYVSVQYISHTNYRNMYEIAYALLNKRWQLGG